MIASSLPKLVSNLRLKHYLDYKVRWKKQIKAIKHGTMGYALSYTQSFLQLYKNTHRDVTDFSQVPPTPLIYHHGESRKMCRSTKPQGVT